MRSWLAGLLLVGGCATELDDARDGAGLTEVQWVLDHDVSGLDWQRVGWCTVTDLGFEVCVTEARVVSATAALVQCEDTVARGPVGLGWLLPTAVAGHPGDTDPSYWAEGHVEDLTDPTPAVVGERALFGDPYCQAHWAVSTAWEGTANLEESDLLGTSLELTGSWRAPSGVWGPLQTHSSLSWGELREVPALGDGGGAVEVRIVRELATLFDGVDFVRPDEELDRSILRNLAAHTRFEVHR